MENEKRQRIIDTICNLSRISNPENGAFENEMAVAAAKMQKLMDMYSISPEEIFAMENREIDKFFEQQTDCMFGRILRWEWYLAQIISRITHTKHYAKNIYRENGKSTIKGDVRLFGKTIGFWGRETNVASACNLYQLWLYQINAMATKATSDYCRELIKYHNAKIGHHVYNNAHQIPNLGSEHPNIFKTSWLEGCMSAISRALNKEEQQRSEQVSSALAIYDSNLAAAWMAHSKNFRNTAISTISRLNSVAYAQGIAAGQSIHINQKNLKG